MNATALPIERDLTYDERATWGQCPVCQAKHGEWCDGTRGMFAALSTLGGRIVDNGVHLGRLQQAPRRVRQVEIA